MWWIGFEDTAELAAGVGTFAGLVTGWMLAPRAVSSRSIWGSGLLGAAGGTLLGILGMLILAVLAQPFALMLWPLFLAFGALLGFPIALPTAFVAFALLRATAGRWRWVAAAVLALSAAIIVLGLPAIACADNINARRRLPNLASKPAVAALMSVKLDWEIANCSPWMHTVRVTETYLDGTRSIHDLVAPSQTAVSGVMTLQPGWESTIEADPSADIPVAWRGPHDALRDALGEDMKARFEIAPNGERSLHIESSTRRGSTGVLLCPLNAIDVAVFQHSHGLV